MIAVVVVVVVEVLLLFLADRIQSMGSSIFLFCVENLSCLLRV